MLTRKAVQRAFCGHLLILSALTENRPELAAKVDQLDKEISKLIEGEVTTEDTLSHVNEELEKRKMEL